MNGSLAEQFKEQLNKRDSVRDKNLAAGRNSHRSSSQNRPDKGLFMRV